MPDATPAPPAPFDAACKAIGIAATMPGIPDTAATLTVLTVTFNADSSVTVDCDGTTAQVPAAKLGMPSAGGSGSSGSAGGNQNGLPSPPVQQ